METMLEPTTFSVPARAHHLECRVATGEEGLLLCKVFLDRPLTQEEKAWFETAEGSRDPAPQLFLLGDGFANFLCAPEEKSHWIMVFEGYLSQAWEEV